MDGGVDDAAGFAEDVTGFADDVTGFADDAAGFELELTGAGRLVSSPRTGVVSVSCIPLHSQVPQSATAWPGQAIGSKSTTTLSPNT